MIYAQCLLELSSFMLLDFGMSIQIPNKNILPSKQNATVKCDFIQVFFVFSRIF